MRAVGAESVAEELVKMFARVGIPGEILTDQGSNFTSQLLTEMYRLLHIRPIRTTPYHPQTDGLVERFNQTLKSMLRKFATQKEKDWDKLISYVLFAYREVPQRSIPDSPRLSYYTVGRCAGLWMCCESRGWLGKEILRASYLTSWQSGRGWSRCLDWSRRVSRKRNSHRRPGMIRLHATGPSMKVIWC